MNDHQRIDILIVEDNPHDLELTLLALKRHNLGERLQTVRNGEEALDFLLCQGRFRDRNIEDTPRFILLDLKLPKINGIEILEKIKSHETLKLIPVVVLSTSMEEKDLIQCYQLGVNSYIVKPVDYQKFIEIILEIGRYWLFVNELPK